MRKTTSCLFLVVLLLNGGILAQEEDLAVKGIIPFELKEHLIIIKGKINGSQNHYNFLLDTGGLTFIDKEVAKELGLKTRGNMAKMDTLKMREVSIHNIFAFTTFNLEPHKKYGILLHGIIGSNLLERFEVTLDYRNQRMIISPDKEVTRENVKSYRCRFTNHRINNAPMIECTINGNVSVKAMVDTGQPYSIVFPPEYLDKLNAGNNPSIVKSKGVMIKWPDTKTIDSYLGRLDQFEQGNLKINNLMCCFAELPPLLSVPLLGRDYLGQFLITIDYPNDEILFVPYEDALFVENMFSFGVNLSRGESNTIVVEGLWTGGPADREGIEVGDEIVECNSTSLIGDDIFELRQFLEKESVKDIKLVVKNKEGQHEISLQKELLLDTRNLRR
ncbi:MAG: aspartyl protease family protein [Candidatus Aminicenantes bacterium]|nr:MAG: aspartyl protease family protein [Candidatus Aminicenantes bacterium]